MMAARIRAASIFRFDHRRRSLAAKGIGVGYQTNTTNVTTAGRRGNAALLHHFRTPSRFIHTTPLIFSSKDVDEASPFSRLSKSNSTSSGHNGKWGGNKSNLNTHHHDQVATTAASISQTFDNDAPYYYDNTTDEYNFEKKEEISQLQMWHEKKEGEFQLLNAQTTKLLQDGSSNKKGIDTITSQLQQWNEFISSITTEMDFDFRTKHPYYPPSEFMTSITYDAAERATSLLMHLTQQREKIPPQLEVRAHKLVMSAWSNVFHWSSGDRCEEILEVYGQKFGGDMNYMPSIEDYKTVMRAHLKSCSSRYSTAAAVDYEDSTTAAAASPGEKALGILNLLNNVYTAGDLFLKPDVELFSHTIAVVRNTVLDWQLRRRFCVSDAKFENELVLELLSVLEQMEGTMAEEAAVGEDDAKVHYSLDKWRCIVRAYSDVIAVASRAPLENEDAELTDFSEQILTLEQFISSNEVAILQSARGENESDNALVDEIQSCIEGAYLSQVSSQVGVSDFNAILANASASEQTLNRMRERSERAASKASKLYPAPTPDHVQALIRAYVECLKRKYFRSEFNMAVEKLEELPHLKAQRLLKELEVQQAGRPIDGSLYSDISWAYTQIPHWPSIHKGDKYTFATKASNSLLKHTMHQYSQGSINFSSVGTATKMYNNLFNLYSQMARNSKNTKGREVSMKKCLELLDEMEYWYKESGGAIAKPDSLTLSLILRTILNSGLSSSFDCAQTILQRLANFGVKAKQGDYLVVMKIANDPTKVEGILNQVKDNYYRDQTEKPTTALYSECISAYARSRDQNSPSKVLELFDELDDLYQSTGDPDFRPDSKLYGATVDAICKSKSKGDSAIRQAMKLLERMERDFDSGMIDAGPNRYAYTSILSSISHTKAPDGHMLAEDLLRRMRNRSRQANGEDVQPDTVAYTALLQALARSRSPDKIEKATKWFAEMETLYMDGDSDLKPNKITYNALINCWRTSGRPDSGEQAQKVLELVEHRYQEGDHEIKPDAMLYSSVIDAWSRGKSKEKVERAWDLYSSMRKQYANGNLDMKPNDIIVSNHCCLSMSQQNH